MDNLGSSDNNNSSSTGGSVDELVQTYPASSFPAWVPSVSVAVGMMVFLAASFYIRHRKVIKKREILMDYFYIIFQYGGMRRKRMVAALCNTNAITLRELGRSFMISFDSIANTENSCPFYLEEGTAFSTVQSHSTTPVMQKKSFLKTRGMLSGKKSRAPFRRYGTTSEESQGPNPVSFQDILMKFKSKRNVGGSPSIPTTPRRLAPQQLQGSSMSTIYGDDFDFQKYVEDNHLSPPPSPYHSHRRNAYVSNYVTHKPNLADIVSEVGRYSLGNVQTGRVRVEQVKRNSEPCQTYSYQQHSQSPQHSDVSGVFQVHGDRLPPSSIVCGSHGFIPKAHEVQNLKSYRNSEPTILIHAASNDSDSSQGWGDIRSRYTNGLVFLKKMPKGDGTTGEFYYEEETIPQPKAGRASLSKVNYVPSGNMNEYYNCLHNPKKEDVENCHPSPKNPIPLRSNTGNIPRPSRNKRMSLGEIAVSNFNKRIEIASESLPEWDLESSMDSKESQDSAIHQTQTKSRTTWMRFKNVFSGSRAGKKTDTTQIKSGTSSLPAMDDRYKRRNRRQNSRWQKFVSVFTGFRSLPESQHSVEMEKPKGSNSFPSMLDAEQFDRGGPTRWHSEKVTSCTNETELSSELPEYSRDIDTRRTGNIEILRPTDLTLPPKTRSFPEELGSGRQYYQRFKNVFDASTAMKDLPIRRNHSQYRHNQKQGPSVESTSASLPRISDYFNGHPLHTGSLPDDFTNTFRFKNETDASVRAVTPGRLEGNSETFSPHVSRRVRSLSPLPERSLSYSPSKDVYPPVDSGIASGGSVQLTPTGREHLHSGFVSDDNISNISDHHTSPRHSGQSVSNNVCGLRDAYNIFPNVPAIKQPTDPKPLNSDIIMTVEPVWIKQELSNSILPTYTTQHRKGSDFELGKRASQTDQLIPEHRSLALSNDSVYYDTVSVFNTPSPQDNNQENISLPVYDYVTSQDNVRLHTPCKLTKSDPTGNSQTRRHSNTSDSTRLSRSQPTTPTSCHFPPSHSPRSASPLGFQPYITNSNNLDHSRFPSHSPVHSECIDRTQSANSSRRHSECKDEGESIPRLPDPDVERASLYATAKLLNETNSMQTIKPSGQGPYSPIPCDHNVFASPQTFRHSKVICTHTPTRTPERSPTRHDGYISNEETFKANVTRLPRFPRRASYGAALSYGTVPDLSQYRGEGNLSKGRVEEEQIQMTTTATTTPAPVLAAPPNESLSQSQVTISPYDTLI